MARPIWTGSVAFGLVNVAVGLYTATEDKTVHFNQFQAGSSDRIRYKRVNERTGREVKLADIVHGREVGDGDYVLISDEELEAVEPGRSRTIDITDFVDLAEIDPAYFQKTYYLGPRGEEAARPYALLHRAMADAGMAGIATFVMHGKQYLVTIRAQPDVLALETLFWADEVRDPREMLEGLPDETGFRSRELTMAKQLIESMSAAWEPQQYRDTYRERVEDLIERKRRGEEVVTEGEEPEDENVVDLMEALHRSAEAAKARQRDGTGSRSGTGRSTATRTRSAGSGARSGSRARPADGRKRAGGSGKNADGGGKKAGGGGKTRRAAGTASRKSG